MKRLPKGVIVYIIVVMLFFTVLIVADFLEEHGRNKALYIATVFIGYAGYLFFFAFPIVYAVIRAQTLRLKAFYPLLILVSMFLIAALADVLVRYYG